MCVGTLCALRQQVVIAQAGHLLFALTGCWKWGQGVGGWDRRKAEAGGWDRRKAKAVALLWGCTACATWTKQSWLCWCVETIDRLG